MFTLLLLDEILTINLALETGKVSNLQPNFRIVGRKEKLILVDLAAGEL